MATVKSRGTLLVLLALVIAGASLAYRAVNPSGNSQADPAAGKPAEPEGLAGKSQREERFPGVDPALKIIIHRLEASLKDWHKNRPPYVHALHRKAWEEFTREKIDELEIARIAALAAMLHDTRDGGTIWEYEESIYVVWGLRDFAGARAYLLKLATEEGPQPPNLPSTSTEPIDTNVENYMFAGLGQAMRGPREAWTTFLADKDDPAVNGFVNPNKVVYGLFKIYSAQQPQETWSLILAEKDTTLRYLMFDGFLAGAPAGQDWTELLDEFNRLTPAGEKRHLGELTGFASRWMIEEPERALDWFVAHVDREDVKRRLLLGDDEDPPDFAINVKMMLLDNLYFDTSEYRSPEIVAILQRLASDTDEALAARAVSRFIGTSMSPTGGLPILAVIPRFKSATLRNELFLAAARAVPPREYTAERYSLDMTFDHPNVCLDAVRALAAELDLSDETRAQAEAALRNLEAQEAKTQAAHKQGFTER